MEFRIASSFQDSLTKLTNSQRAAAALTVLQLQTNPASPGLQPHRLDKNRDPNFWSARVNQDVRLIYHQLGDGVLVCYVDHHDKAYKWAENRKLEVHPTTGAAQIVEIRETVKEIVIPKYVEVEQPKLPLFAGISDDELLGYGVPESWLNDVKQANEDTLLTLADHLPAEAAEALLELATGGRPTISEPIPAGTNPFEHPDAQRRFRVMTDVEELTQALDEPWEKWAIFLHPAQRQFAERDFNGPARVSGSAGTGKTVVALHRAVNLARKNPDSTVLLVTFSSELAYLLRSKLFLLVRGNPRLAERIEVQFLDHIGSRLYEFRFGKREIAAEAHIREALSNAAANMEGHSFTTNFLYSEWKEVIDAWQIRDWEAYRDFARLGRKIRLSESKRIVLWQIFERARQDLTEQGLITYAEVFQRLTEEMLGERNRPYDFAVVDEAQDIKPAQLKFLAALAGNRPNGLFFAGDLGQRIFQQAYSWKSLGVDVRGRSRTLRVNYRTSHQIRASADRLLGPDVVDVDGNIEERRGTVSVFNGPQPAIKTFDSNEAEIEHVAAWITDLVNSGIAPNEIAVFVRSGNEIDRARQAVLQTGYGFTDLNRELDETSDRVSIGTMHLAKGLEFKAVAVMACDDDVIPSQKRIGSVTEESDLKEVYDTERHLLYVACTRARDYLLVTSGDVPSEFLVDIV